MSEARDQIIARRLAALAKRSASLDAGTMVIGVTGSSAKSTTTRLLAHILAATRRVAPLVPMTTVQSIEVMRLRAAQRYDVLVVEAALGIVDGMKALAAALRPDTAIVTMIALEHKNLFPSVDAIGAEKSQLVSALRPGGLAVLNGDDPRVTAMVVPPGARAVRVGRADGAQYRASDIQGTFPDRLRLNLEWSGGTLPLRTNFVGAHFWLPTAAACAAALEHGVPPETVADRVASFAPLMNRCGVLDVQGGPRFILDTFKAPWHSLKLAFDVMQDVVAPRRRIVLGHIADFRGSNTKYRDACRMARAVADEVILVGDHISHARPTPEDLRAGRVRQFATTEQAADHVKRSAIAGEVILLKGNVDLHLERIAYGCERQIKCWIATCRLKMGCADCGRYLDGDPGVQWPIRG